MGDSGTGNLKSEKDLNVVIDNKLNLKQLLEEILHFWAALERE